MVTGSANERIAVLAEAQAGRVGRWQLLDGGLSDDQIRWRLAHGSLIRRRRGVYAVGHGTPTADSDLIEALLTRGPEALICSHAAAGLHGFRAMCAGVDLLVPDTQGGGGSAGIRIHRSRSAADLTPSYVRGIPVVAPALALLQIAAAISSRALEVALDEAFGIGCVNRDEVRAVVAAHRNAPGVGSLGRLLEQRLVGNPTRSPGQERLLALVRAAELPDPEMDASIGEGFSLDLFWRRERVGVEYDSFRWHRSRGSWARDRRKDAYCRRQGIALVRVADEQLCGDGPFQLVRHAGPLARASGPGLS